MAEKKAAAKKAAPKKTTKKAAAPKAEAQEIKTEETFTLAQVEQMLAEAAEKAAKEAYAKAQAEAAQNTIPQVIRIADDAPKVVFRWRAAIADDCVTMFGDNGLYGKITGKSGMVYVPKNELSRFLTPTNRYYIENRWLVYVSGLDEAEQEQLGVVYKKGEVMDANAFAAILDMGDELLTVYPDLCESYKEMVVSTFIDAYEAGDKRVTRELVEKLNALSKNEGDKKGAFSSIIEDMAFKMMD